MEYAHSPSMFTGKGRPTEVGTWMGQNKRSFKHLLILFLLPFLSICSCATDSEKSTSEKSSVSSDISVKEVSNTAILIFKKEKTIEIRVPDQSPSIHSIQLDSNFPIGVFRGAISGQGIEIKFPNEFYKSKSHELEFNPKIDLPKFDLNSIEIENTLIYVFPNDTRNGGSFVADFSSPHWKSEIYAKMEFHLKEFD